MLNFQPLQDNDLPLVEAWLNKDHVKRWYEIPRLDVTIQDWMYELKERNGEYCWLNHLLVLYGDTPIGMCQYYRCEDSADENFGAISLAGSYGIDYLIGEEAYLGRGFGREIITKLVEKIFSFPDAQRVTADIDRENKASEGTLLSCGFSLMDAKKSRYVLNKN